MGGADKYPLTERRLALPSVRGLVGALEPARSSGMFAAQQVAAGLVKEGFATPLEVAATGDLHWPPADGRGWRKSMPGSVTQSTWHAGTN